MFKIIYTKNKVAKNFGLLFKLYTNKYCIIFTYIPILTTEILHGEVKSERTLKKMYSRQNHAIQTVYSKDRVSHTRETH